jgi:sugar transferase (PEP-CTERM/EpsH1 system associated)
MSRKRVVHVVPSLEPGGLENGVVNVIARSDQGEIDHAVVCLERAGAFAGRLPAGVPVIVIGKRRGSDPAALVRTSSAVRALGADIVHTRNWASLVEGAVAARAAGARHVHGLHGRTQLELEGVSRRRRLVEGFVARRADRVYALLPGLLPEVASLGVPPAKTCVLENGVDLERFRPDPAARARVRAEIGVGDDAVLVGCVARLDPVKDHATLLRAATKLPARASLVLAGDGPLRRSLEQLARVEGIAARVRFLGHRDDSIYPALDVFALASRYEGSSNTILEAMACGLPVVATRVGGNPSLVGAGTGTLVEPGDASALGAALSRLALDARARRSLGRAALAFAGERSLERMARAYEALYRSTLGSHAA